MTPPVVTTQDGFPAQTSPTLVIMQPDPGVCAEAVVLVVVVVVADALADVDDEVDALVVASPETVAEDDADVVASAGAAPRGAPAAEVPPAPPVAVVSVVLTVVGCGVGLGRGLDVVTVELTAATVSAPAAAGWSRSITAAPAATIVTAITAMYKHLRTSDPLTYSERPLQSSGIARTHG